MLVLVCFMCALECMCAVKVHVWYVCIYIRLCSEYVCGDTNSYSHNKKAGYRIVVRDEKHTFLFSTVGQRQQRGFQMRIVHNSMTLASWPPAGGSTCLGSSCLASCTVGSFSLHDHGYLKPAVWGLCVWPRCARMRTT